MMTSKSKTTTTKRKKQPLTIRAVHPNAGVEAWYRRQLDKQVQEMQASVVYWLSANYRASGAAVAMDASPAVMMRNAMQKLAKRWTRRFDDMAQKLVDRFANDAMKNADASLATAFKDAGFTVEFKMTSQMNNALQATIAENVGLIRSIPEKYFTEVEGLVMRSVARGRDLSYLTDELRSDTGLPGAAQRSLPEIRTTRLPQSFSPLDSRRSELPREYGSTPMQVKSLASPM